MQSTYFILLTRVIALAVIGLLASLPLLFNAEVVAALLAFPLLLISGMLVMAFVEHRWLSKIEVTTVYGKTSGIKIHKLPLRNRKIYGRCRFAGLKKAA